MKKNSLLSLALLTALVSSATAAQSQTPSDVVALPTYVVSSPRYSPAEQHVNASLNSLRTQAGIPAYNSVALPALKAQLAQTPAISSAARLAKF